MFWNAPGLLFYSLVVRPRSENVAPSFRKLSPSTTLPHKILHSLRRTTASRNSAFAPLPYDAWDSGERRARVEGSPVTERKSSEPVCKGADGSPAG